eukprot:CAMPEP_0180118244 /NCGR_PEP_ID=MMETSP0986-20121125/1353_1 /TAXON_ID=697907 /ORGANISM="non described non described, Strain CCMP2293" /LENGTH=82 /DNA_ID=CAMNT_0022057181 /DNA_START=439 /DNA_END=687 /DNA_ORIENTATION=-
MGLPDANTARPSVHAYASFARHSALWVGLESAKMRGDTLISPIASTTSLVNAPERAATPMSADGLSVWMQSISVAHSGVSWA